MGAYNVVTDVLATCPRCHVTSRIGVQFKYGATWQYRYAVGETIGWGQNDIGTPGACEVVADAAADSACSNCGYDGDWDFYVFIDKDRIADVVPADGRYDFVIAGSTYLVMS